MQGNDKQLGFWSCWSLTVGVMIGSGVFLLPSVLAPFGLLSFGGWLITGGGSILLALVFARLASRTDRSGGVFVYTRDAFGDLPAFIIAWGYWTCYWIAVPAMAIAFVGYLGIFVPELGKQPQWQCFAALVLIWCSILINAKGVKEATAMQLLMTILKLVPLFLVVSLAAFAGNRDHLPTVNPQGLPLMETLATTALLTMWAFSGMEAGTMPASDVRNPKRVIPRAVFWGTMTVAIVYITSTAAVMSLVPAQDLAQSTAPFADAARGLGSWGPALVAIGAMISTAGAMHGVIFVSGQIPMAVALDGLAPRRFAHKNAGGAPTVSLLITGVLSSLLLIGNYAKGLIEMFTFLAMMSTLAFMVPMLVCSLAEFRYSLAAGRGWAAVAMLAFVYSVFAVLGSGLEVIAWGVLFLLAGVPIYYFLKASSGQDSGQ